MKSPNSIKADQLAAEIQDAAETTEAQIEYAIRDGKHSIIIYPEKDWYSSQNLLFKDKKIFDAILRNIIDCGYYNVKFVPAKGGAFRQYFNGTPRVEITW